MTRNIFVSLTIGSLLLTQVTFGVSGQSSNKAASDWSSSDPESVLNNSPWVKTQSVLVVNSKVPDALSEVTFNIRLISALPMREALKRRSRRSEDKWLATWVDKLVSKGPGDFIIIAVGRKLGPDANKMILEWILPSSYPTPPATFLELADGRKVTMHAYKRTQDQDLLGIYIFPRVKDEKPFIADGDPQDLRFTTEFTSGSQGGLPRRTTIEARFHLKDLSHAGKLEY